MHGKPFQLHVDDHAKDQPQHADTEPEEQKVVPGDSAEKRDAAQIRELQCPFICKDGRRKKRGKDKGESSRRPTSVSKTCMSWWPPRREMSDVQDLVKPITIFTALPSCLPK